MTTSMGHTQASGGVGYVPASSGYPGGVVMNVAVGGEQQQQHHSQQQHQYPNNNIINSNQFQRNSSDTSMTNMDPDASMYNGPYLSHHHGSHQGVISFSHAQLSGAGSGIPLNQQPPPSGHSQSVPNSMELLSLDDDTVPTVFKWEHGGRQVYITGTFNNWSRQIPMHRSGNDFTYIHNLKRGKHAFKFIVDDEWRFAPDQPTVADIEGRINNFIDVSDFKPYTGDKDFEKEKAAAEYGIPAAGPGGAAADDLEGDTDEVQGMMGGGGAARPDKDGEHNMPDLDDYTKEPPPLPPHLRHIILNKPPQLQDTAALPVPQHVALNHLYCTAIKDATMVLGITQRFKTKFVTTVYYSPCSSK
jgi:5'-AMP-activated protein kinase, regulatory beta subunit